MPTFTLPDATEVETTTTYLQGSFRAPSAATIRVTHHATPATSDLVIAAGDTWESLDAFLLEWNAQLAADLGADKVELGIDADPANGTGSVVIAADTGLVSVTWSQSGDGTAIRDWLGHDADVVSEASPYTFTDPHLGGWYPQIGAQTARRATSTRHRAMSVFQDGTTETQSMVSPGESDRVALDLTVWFSGSHVAGLSGYTTTHTALRDFVDDLFDDGSGPTEPILLVHDGDEWTCRLDGERVRLQPRRVEGSLPDEVWEVAVPLVGESCPW